MASIFSDNISFIGKKSNFERDAVKDVAALLAVDPANEEYDYGHIVFCEENGKHYKFNYDYDNPAVNSKNDITGWFAEFPTGGGTSNVEISYDEAREALNINTNATGGGGGSNTGGGGNIAVDEELSKTSINPVQNKVVTEALDGKQEKLVSGENVKTVNGQSILGEGNIDIVTTSGDNVVRVTDLTFTKYPARLNNAVATSYSLEGYNYDLRPAYQQGYRYVKFYGANYTKNNENIIKGLISTQDDSVESYIPVITESAGGWEILPITEKSKYLKATYNRSVSALNKYKPTHIYLIKDKESAFASLYSNFESIGAIYNPTDEIIKRQIITYGKDVAIANYVTYEFNHYPKCWYLNGIGDITDGEMMRIYNAPHNSIGGCGYVGYPDCRTFIFNGNYNSTSVSYDSNFIRATALTSLIFSNGIFSSTNYRSTFRLTRVKYILSDLGNSEGGHFYGHSGIASNCFNVTTDNFHPLEEIRIYWLNNSADFSKCPNLSKLSLLFMINGSNCTTNITITLHPDAYARLATDDEVVETRNRKNENLASQKGNIDLISA